MINYKGMIVIHGDLYRISGNRKLLFPVLRPAHGFRVASLEKTTVGYKGMYDTAAGKIVKPGTFAEGSTEGSKLKNFLIPLSVLTNSRSLSENEIAQYNHESLTQRQGIYLVNRELSLRLNGQLPEVEFDGITYRIDLEKRELRQVDNPNMHLRLAEESPWQTTVQYYDPQTKKFVEKPQLAADLEKLNVVTLPPMSAFDVVGIAKMSGLQGTALLCDFPFRGDPLTIKMQTEREYYSGLQKGNVKKPIVEKKQKPVRRQKH